MNKGNGQLKGTKFIITGNCSMQWIEIYNLESYTGINLSCYNPPLPPPPPRLTPKDGVN